jgi:hypothetical protein
LIRVITGEPMVRSSHLSFACSGRTGAHRPGDDPVRAVGRVRVELGDLVLGKLMMRPFVISRGSAVQAAAEHD